MPFQDSKEAPSQEGAFFLKPHFARKRGKPFTMLAEKAAAAAGSPAAFLLAGATILIWAATGPIYDFSETWQIVINTATTIVTFLLVFLIQNSQNRETRALQLKLDELIRATKGAHNTMLNLEQLDDEELQKLYEQYDRLAEIARAQLERGQEEKSLEPADQAADAA